MSPEEDLDTARLLVTEFGVPVFAAYEGRYPDGWQHIEPDPDLIDRWRPGMLLCMVTGRGLDLVDFDPRNGGTPEVLNGQMPTVYARQTTPSGGEHRFVRSLGVRSHNGLLSGVDIKAGTPDGQGRGLAFLAPSVRESKGPDRKGEPVPYRWIDPPDADRWRTAGADDQSGAALAELVRSASGRELANQDTGQGARGPGLAALLSAGMDDGLRDVWLTQVAGHLARNHRSYEDYLANLLLINEQCCRPPLKPSQVHKVARSIWGTEQNKRVATISADDQKVRDEVERLLVRKVAREHVQALEALTDPESCRPVDWDTVLSDEYEDPKPTMLVRSDGRGLLYPGMSHWLASEPGSGKSWLALAACAEQMAAGRHVVYIDFEDTPRQLYGRLRKLGATDEAIRAQFHLFRPNGSILGGWGAEYGRVLADLEPALVAIDAVTDAMTVEGLDPNVATDVKKFALAYLDPASNAGAASLAIDHVTKDSDRRGLWAIGSQHKVSEVSGASYSMRMVQPLALGQVGRAVLKVAKDRHGQVGARGAEVAVFILDSTGDRMRWRIAPPTEMSAAEVSGLHEQDIVKRLKQDGPQTKTGLLGTGRQRKARQEALDRLVTAGRLHPTTAMKGQRPTTMYALADPVEDSPEGGDDE